MKNISLLFYIFLLASCGSTNEGFNINGAWELCHTLNNTDYIYEELIVNNTESQKSIYNALDSECVTIDALFVNRDIATHSLDNPHYTNSGLFVYDSTLANIIRQNSTGTTSIPKWYTIVHRENNRLYFGTSTGTNDGSSVENRHTEINTNIYLTKK